jgi:hypothetical protein
MIPILPQYIHCLTLGISEGGVHIYMYMKYLKWYRVLFLHFCLQLQG